MRGGRQVQSSRFFLTLFVGMGLILGMSHSFGQNTDTSLDTPVTDNKNLKPEDTEEELSNRQTVELPDVTVTAERQTEFTTLPPRDVMRRPWTESPGLETATSVVGRYEIEQLDAYSIVDAMEFVPGAWTESRGRKVKQFFSIRGQRYPYPSYTIDGAWFREFHETNYYLDATFFERIEINRSSSAMLLGPGSMTGIINLVPRRFDESQTIWDGYFGSDNTWRTSLLHGDTKKDFGYAVGSSFRHTDGPDHENARENITNFYLGTTYKMTSDLTLDFNAFSFTGDRELQLADPPASNTLQTRKDSFDPMHTYVFMGKAHYEPSNTASTELTVNYAKRRFRGHRNTTTKWLEEDYEYGAGIIQSLKLMDENTLRFGGMINHWESPTGKRFYVGRPGDITTYSIVVVDEHDFGRLDLNFGYRFSQTYINQFGGFDIEGSASGLTSVEVRDDWEDPLHMITFGGAYDLGADYSLYGNYTWGQISARPGMLNDDLQRPGVETRNKFDLGIKKIWENFGEVSLTGFYVLQDNAALLSGGFVTVDDDDFALYENADRKNCGVEMDLRTKRFENGLQFFLNTVWMQTNRTVDGDWEMDEEVPEFILGGGGSYLFRDFELSALVKQVSDYENQRFLPGGSEPVPLGDYIEVDVKLSYYFGSEKENSVFFRVDNLNDKKYSTVVGYPDEGRRYTTGVSLVF